MREIATPLCYILVIGLFWLDRRDEAKTSYALWLPFIDVLINGSRPVSIWLGIAPPSGGGSIYVEGSPVDRAIYIALLAGAVVVLIGRRDRVGRLLRNNTAILLFLALALVSLTWSEFPLVTFKHWIKCVCDLSMGLIIVTELEPLVAARKVLVRAGFILIPFSLLLCKYYPALGRRLSKGWALLYCGVTQDKNELGAICVIFGLASLWCFLAAWYDRDREDRRRRMIAHAIIVGICGWLLGMCDSMTSISSLVMLGVVMLVVYHPSSSRSASKVHLAVGAVVGLSLFAMFASSGGALLQEVGRNQTLTGRTDVWHDVLQIPNNPLVGTGYESFWLGERLTQMRAVAGFDVNEAHNGYLEIYLNLGWAGVSLLALMIAAGYRKLTIAYRRNPVMGSLGLALFLATLFHSLTEAGFRMETPTWIFFLWAILAASQVNLAGEAALDAGGDHEADLAQADLTAEPAIDAAYPWESSV